MSIEADFTKDETAPPSAGSNSLADLAARINAEHEAVVSFVKRGLTCGATAKTHNRDIFRKVRL